MGQFLQKPESSLDAIQMHRDKRATQAGVKLTRWIHGGGQMCRKLVGSPVKALDAVRENPFYLAP